MTIVKNNSLINTGYSKGFQMLTNFVFEILSVEYRDNLYGYFAIELRKKNREYSVIISDITICGPDGGNFQKILSGNGNWMFNPCITHDNIIEIFSYEFDQFKISQEIKKLQNDQLAYGNQSAALENSTIISYKDKQTLRSHYYSQQTELQERINKLTNELSVVGSETIIEKTDYPG